MAGQRVVDQALLAGKNFWAQVATPLVIILCEQGQDFWSVMDHGDVDNQVWIPDALLVTLAAPEPAAWTIDLLFLPRKLEPLGLEAPDPGELGAFGRHFRRQHPFKVAVTVGQMTQQISLVFEHGLADPAFPLLVAVLGLELIPEVREGQVDQQVSVVPDLKEESGSCFYYLYKTYCNNNRPKVERAEVDEPNDDIPLYE